MVRKFTASLIDPDNRERGEIQVVLASDYDAIAASAALAAARSELAECTDRVSKYALECLKAEARLSEATQLLRDAANYLRPGESHDADYKDFSRRFAEFLRAAMNNRAS